MTVILLASACAVLWSGAPRAAHRLRPLGGRHTRSTTGVPTLRRIVVPIGICGALLVGGIAAAVAAGLVAGVYGWRAHRRRAAEQADARRDDLLTALSLMIAELSVGAPPAHACAAAAAEMSAMAGATRDGVTGQADSVASALSMLAGRAELGGGILIDPTAAHGADESWQRIAVAWQTSEAHGLPLADLLGSVRSDLLARKAFVERTRAGMAGPRATATVLAGLPVLGIALGQATGAQPLSTLLGGGLGGILLVGGTALVASGLLWADSIAAKVVAP
ncbi:MULTISPECIES: type II secretion system protein F [unclassified Gordonia (in: high G+C Gram-positive bacteria)]|uniref:type II secretion system F family protein n=1 Tax=unclassified Gordonia (in: high G+C Gram-positive bacteria) TaxID=2657482 RepID=UPI0009AEFA32|nr:MULTISPECIES: type II secretion system protein F [unclassified Gordonia (in: high G+C Gram-positive bacteria)]MDF3280611.1 type II secretion system protein F [Gordonia sp. N1V]OPX12664.1 type II secretion system protein F [Gordonia sp. i37]